DVHATRDGVVVVHHDDRLGLRSGSFAGRAIAELDSATLGPTVDPLAADEGIPTLAAVLQAVPDTATVYVEIKGREIESIVASVINQSRVRCAVHSFDHAAIARIRTIAPS